MSEDNDIKNIEDFKEEICDNCHHKTSSCEENIEDCYEHYEFKAR